MAKSTQRQLEAWRQSYQRNREKVIARVRERVRKLEIEGGERMASLRRSRRKFQLADKQRQRERTKNRDARTRELLSQSSKLSDEEKQQIRKRNRDRAYSHMRGGNVHPLQVEQHEKKKVHILNFSTVWSWLQKHNIKPGDINHFGCVIVQTSSLPQCVLSLVPPLFSNGLALVAAGLPDCPVIIFRVDNYEVVAETVNTTSTVDQVLNTLKNVFHPAIQDVLLF